MYEIQTQNITKKSFYRVNKGGTKMLQQLEAQFELCMLSLYTQVHDNMTHAI